jgi:hypothetical protein
MVGSRIGWDFECDWMLVMLLWAMNSQRLRESEAPLKLKAKLDCSPRMPPPCTPT